MKIIAVDDEKLALEAVITTIQKCGLSAEVQGFRSGLEAEEYVQEHGCDVAFLDIEMRDISGIDLAKHLKDINPSINIIFTTGYGEFAGAAFDLHASGYIMKPVTKEKIEKELGALRFAIGAPKEKKRVVAQTFGNFEVFLDGLPMKFKYSKSKELLAYLIDRNGALCTTQELLAVLWEDDDEMGNHTSYFKNVRSDLLAILEEAGVGDIIVRQRGGIGIIPSKISCDYYDYLAGDPTAKAQYQGEYMVQYSWSEMTHGLFE
ncbi:MAG: response regulator [Lachnospiraceae bacterium]|nr:response regulator [Lachnospiraceae bacterium]MBQ2502747.1 response regulator [Lachnospiraceae bacterium]MBQ2533776.1 response regulator [Lachnospiraceae bacterium]MBQ5385589.1 response regulator [Lachnospiraceae bacterium]MBR0430038.1 response regulator [Lachnospiraceae bacterium]